MKIFFAVKSLHTAGGTERATIVLANELASRGYEISLISLDNEGAPFFKVSPQIKIVYIYNGKDKRPSLVRDVSRRVALRKLYKAEKPDLIIIVGTGRSLLNLPVARGIPTIGWEHFNINVNWHLFHPLSRRLAARYCDRIVTLTQQDAENYRMRFAAKNVVCIPNPVTITGLQPTPLNEKRVLASGRLTKQKGFDLLLDAWNLTKERHNGWKLRIIGSGKMKAILEEKIRKYGLNDTVEMIASSDNMAAQYLQSSVFVLSSRHEGLPLVLIEAMATGLPIVSFDCETGPRDIVHQNVTGFLIPPLDVEELAAKLDTVMQDELLRKSFSENALKYSGRFETGKIIDKWETMIREILMERQTRASYGQQYKKNSSA